MALIHIVLTSTYCRGEFLYNFLLTAIDDGKIGLFQTPPALDNSTDQTSCHYTNDIHMEWIFLQAQTIGLTPREILNLCIDEFECLFQDRDRNEINYSSILEMEVQVSQDLTRLQINPAIMQHYRRFVVLREGENGFHNDGVSYLYHPTSSCIIH